MSGHVAHPFVVPVPRMRTSGHVGHPLIAPLPPVVPVAARALRWAALRRMRSHWRGGSVDLVLPSGAVQRLGAAGPAAPRVMIHDDRMFLRMLARGELGAGESYVAGEWSTANGDELVAALRVFLGATGARGVESPLTRLGQLVTLVRHRRTANTHTGSARNVHAHYDLGNAFYKLFLDEETLGYSCGIWPREAAPRALTGSQHAPSDAATRTHADSQRGQGDAATRALAEPRHAATRALADSQHAKHEQLCDWLALSPRDHLLEIGCGWGGMAIHAAKTRGCRVTAITVSREQHDLACQRVAQAGVADRVSLELRDYRDVGGSFDKIVSIEMLEQVGYEYLPVYFAMCARVLAPGGRLAVQTITMPDERFEAYRTEVDWMQTYIFPGALIPSLRAIRAASAPFKIERSQDIGPDYARTLRAWRDRFTASLPEVRALGFDVPFIRTWLLYLAFSEAAFAEQTLGDHQLLFTR